MLLGSWLPGILLRSRLMSCKAKGTYDQLVLKGSKNRTKCKLQAIWPTMPVHMYCRWRLCCFTEKNKEINEARQKKYTLAVSKKTLFEQMRSNVLFFIKKGEKVRTENVIQNVSLSIFLTWKRLIYFEVFAKFYPCTIYEEMKKIPVWSKMKKILKFEFK